MSKQESAKILEFPKQPPRMWFAGTVCRQPGSSPQRRECYDNYYGSDEACPWCGLFEDGSFELSGF